MPSGVVDVMDTDDKYIIKAELPGVDKKDITVDVKNRVLTLKGERSSDSDVKEEKYHLKERSWGSFERRFTLADGIDPEKISADYVDGVLKIEVPKPETVAPRRITIH